MYAVLDVSLQSDSGWQAVKKALGAQMAVMTLINNKIEAVKGKTSSLLSRAGLFAKFSIFHGLLLYSRNNFLANDRKAVVFSL